MHVKIGYFPANPLPWERERPVGLKESTASRMARHMLGIFKKKHPAAMPSHRPVQATGREKWLLVYNCHVSGLANCLTLLTDDIDLDFYDPPGFRAQIDAISKNLDSYDRILVSSRLEETEGIDFSRHWNVSTLPGILFDAYHPDLCYLTDSSQPPRPIKGLVGDYHSLICATAFQQGLSEQDTRKLYHERIYADLGYYDRWAGARDRLLATFETSGYNIATYFPQWSRDGAFMYSVNHPRIHCLRDIALAILDRFGIPALETNLLPHDNLANGPVFPIYPEVASQLGVRGGYRFKLPARYRCIGLEEFIHHSYSIYRASGDMRLSPGSAHLQPVANALREILS